MPESQRPSGITRLIERVPFHPFAFALFPALVVYVVNQDNLVWQQVLRSLIVSELIALAVLLVSRGLLSEWQPAAIFTTLTVLIIFTYGHIYQLIEDWTIGGVAVGRHRYLLAAAALLAASAFFALRSRRLPTGWPTSVLNISAAIALVLQLSGVHLSTPDKLSVVDPSRALPQKFPGDRTLSKTPDIYYIILDAYGRQDLLSQLYGFDNSGFIDWLTSRGFYVAGQSHTNYLRTTLSLASSLNMQYINELQGIYGFRLHSVPTIELIDRSTVRSWLEDDGYQTVAFDTGYSPTTLSDAGVFIRVNAASGALTDRMLVPRFNHFEGMFVDTTIYRAYMDYQVEHGIDPTLGHTYAEQRDRIETIFSTLKLVPEMQGPHFVFAHVIAPHPPFVFGPNGEPLTPTYPFSLADHFNDFKKFGTREEYANGYVGQAQYIDQLVEDTVAAILAKSDPQPIIIIQGDHGPGAYYIDNSLSKTYLPDRASNLNAYLVPDSMKSDLYPEITPVNSFRLLFRDVFHANLDLLPDQTYFYVTDSAPVDTSADLYPLPSPAR